MSHNTGKNRAAVCNCRHCSVKNRVWQIKTQGDYSVPGRALPGASPGKLSNRRVKCNNQEAVGKELSREARRWMRPPCRSQRRFCCFWQASWESPSADVALDRERRLCRHPFSEALQKRTLELNRCAVGGSSSKAMEQSSRVLLKKVIITTC